MALSCLAKGKHMVGNSARIHNVCSEYEKRNSNQVAAGIKPCHHNSQKLARIHSGVEEIDNSNQEHGDADRGADHEEN